MRKILFLLILSVGYVAIAQTDGLVYQAVILDPNSQDIPGEDKTGNVLPNTAILVQFTIEGTTTGIEYREIQATTTDAYGMIKLIIGEGDASIGNFNEIDWDGSRKDLQVDIDLFGSLETLSKQQLLFLPFSYHRDITATGTMEVIGAALLKSDLVVNGTSNLNGRLVVRNESPTGLSGTLEVDGRSTLKDSLTVTNQSPTTLDGRLTVDRETQLNATLTVQEASKLNSTLVVESTTVLNDELRVANQSPTLFTGSLRVDGISDFNSAVNINNGSPLYVSGDLYVGGAVTLNDDLTVEGDTNLNNSLSVNNGSPTTLSGSLDVGGQVTLGDDLLVIGATNLDNLVRVNNQSSTYFTGTMTVGLATNLNSDLSVLNGSPTLLTGPLTVNGEIDFGNDLTVEGITNLFGDLFVNNGSPTGLSGALGVDGPAHLFSSLDVQAETTLNNELTVANQSNTLLTGTLDVNGSTTVNNTLDILNSSPSTLSGTVNVDGVTTLNDNLDVTSGAMSSLSGTLTTDGITNLNNSLFVNNGSPTNMSGALGVNGLWTQNNNLNVTNGSSSFLTGSLSVDGVSNFLNLVTINGPTDIQNDLTVTGNADLTTLIAKSLVVEQDTSLFVASFTNDNDGLGDGIRIKLGRNHGRLLGGSILTIDQSLVSNGSGGPSDNTYESAFNQMKTLLLSGGNIDISDIIGLIPSFQSLGIESISNFVFQEISSTFGLPLSLPGIHFPGFEITIPGVTLPLEIFPGTPRVCSGQACTRICVPLLGCARVCIPPINLCLPRIPPISIPRLIIPEFNLRDLAVLLPDLPFFPNSNTSFPSIEIPDIQAILAYNIEESLSKENQFFTFQDMSGIQTGAVRGQSILDFADNTVFDDVYVFNLAGKFVGIDIPNGLAKGAGAIVSLISEFNKLGVEYSSGNGDYSEWLERIDAHELLNSGDIVAIKGGKITKDLDNFEQLMIVSHRPIVLGNAPTKDKENLGNSVAFIGQVPAKVMGPVNTGDYIVANRSFEGYGIAIAPSEMTTEDFKMIVGRSWEKNLNQGPKLVNTVVGLQNGDFSMRVKALQTSQRLLDNRIETIEERIARITGQLQLSEKTNEPYVANE